MGCATSGANEEPVTIAAKDNEHCIVNSGKLYKGQLDYHHHGINLKLSHCPKTIVDFEVSPDDELYKETAGKIYADPNLMYNYYVNIDFYGSTLADGDVLIEKVVKTEFTDESKFNYR